MATGAELRSLARSKRRAAAVARRAGPSLSAVDHASMIVHAQQLETEAAELEAEADALDRRTAT